MELVQSRHLVWVMSRLVAKTRLTFPSCRDNVTDDNRSGQRTPRRRSQHYTCRGTHSDGQTFILLCMVLNIGLSYGNVQRFVVDVLACLKACPRLVPSALPYDNKAASMRASLSLLQRYAVGVTALCVESSLVIRHGSMISLLLASNQSCSGKTPVHPGRRHLKWHLLAKSWPPSSGCVAAGLPGERTHS